MLVETEVIVGWEWLGLVSACGEDPPRKYGELVGLNYICTSCLASYPNFLCSVGIVWERGKEDRKGI